MYNNIDEMPVWRVQKSPLLSKDYSQFDVVLQVVDAENLQKTQTPYDDLFSAIKKRRARVEDDVPMITLEQGTAVVRVLWNINDQTFLRLQNLRRFLAPLLALSPATLALDVRIASAGEDALYATLIAAANISAIDNNKKRKSVKITLAGGNRRDLEQVTEVAGANTLARRLINMPPNILTPSTFAKKALDLAKSYGLTATLYSEKKLSRMGAGAILAVGRGSENNPPAVVHLAYNPKHKQRIALVGKGVCFDTGGVNIKSASGMRGMTKDMAGAATALAAILACAKKRLSIGVDVWLALAQNDISANAYRPDEVITSLSGQRIEIVHTDAEGRMILADTLTMACAKKPEVVVSFATLTGTMHVALGERMSGFFATNTNWQERALSAAERSGERLCFFPMPDDYFEGLKSKVADIRQCAIPGEADHILAALFLRQFMTNKPDWIHVDLSSASCEGGLGAAPGPLTGFGVSWVLTLIESCLSV